jgi:hypothetical protein
MSQGNEDTPAIKMPVFLPRQRVLSFKSKQTNTTVTDTKPSNKISYVSLLNSSSNIDSIVEFDANFLSGGNISESSKECVKAKNIKTPYLIFTKERKSSVNGLAEILVKKRLFSA